jgi:hypothetical protein
MVPLGDEVKLERLDPPRRVLQFLPRGRGRLTDPKPIRKISDGSSYVACAETCIRTGTGVWSNRTVLPTPRIREPFVNPPTALVTAVDLHVQFRELAPHRLDQGVMDAPADVG